MGVWDVVSGVSSWAGAVKAASELGSKITTAITEYRKDKVTREDGKREQVVENVSAQETRVGDGLDARVDSGVRDRVDETRYRD